MITITLPQQALITQVEADQLVLALLGDRMTASSISSFVSSRAAALAFAGLSGGSPLSDNGKAGYRGVNAGDFGVQRGVWVNASGSFIDDDRPGSSQDGFGGSGAIGADLIFDTGFIGLFAGYGSTELDGALVDYSSRGWTGGAYASWSASPLFRVTGTVGVGNHDVEFGRRAGALRSYGETDREQVFGSIGFQSQLDVGSGWVVVPSLGLLATTSDTDGYVDSGGLPIGSVSSDMTIVQAGGALFYTASAWLPYVSASFNSQTDDTPGVDGDYALLGGGFSAPLSDDLTLGVNVQTLVGKKNERETSFGATLRKSF
ncbi:autotransporter outer membrane beta-barrel domain-containing protein [Phenylobacterium sp.]|uniref:autotransporter outer membrane beta-barrel domain-containing protein n=1 Tax=Phenylobacterium sp. TaxID=1871053 RepID=UPI00286B8871|nr:autotransporter outer membrane beta-barrel domain-containing protein [Phenylobacterium sp.]